MTMEFEPTLTHAIVFSDMVIREAGTGKCSYIGSFQRYTLPQFPVQVPPFFVSIFLTNLGPVRSVNITARIENAQTGMVLGNSAVSVGFGAEPKRADIFEISLPIFGLGFPAPGDHKAVILVNNEKVGERTLPVLSITVSPQPQ